MTEVGNAMGSGEEDAAVHVREHEQSGAPRMVSWYANPTAEQIRTKGKKVAQLRSEESSVWVMEVCEDWRTCHVCGLPAVHADTCTATRFWSGELLAGQPVNKGFKLWELVGTEEPQDGPTRGRWWFSNADARPDGFDHVAWEKVDVGQQRFTALSKTTTKLTLRPGHWVRVYVRAGQQKYGKKLLRFVTIDGELAQRDRAYCALARATGINPVSPAAVVAPDALEANPTQHAKKASSVVKAAVQQAAGHAGQEGVSLASSVRGEERAPVLGVLGGACGEAVQAEKVVEVGVSARGRVLKRREIIGADGSEGAEAALSQRSAKEPGEDVCAVGESTVGSNVKGKKAASKLSLKGKAATRAPRSALRGLYPAKESAAGKEGCDDAEMDVTVVSPEWRKISEQARWERRLSVLPTALKASTSQGRFSVPHEVAEPIAVAVMTESIIHARGGGDVAMPADEKRQVSQAMDCETSRAASPEAANAERVHAGTDHAMAENATSAASSNAGSVSLVVTSAPERVEAADKAGAARTAGLQQFEDEAVAELAAYCRSDDPSAWHAKKDALVALKASPLWQRWCAAGLTEQQLKQFVHRLKAKRVAAAGRAERQTQARQGLVASQASACASGIGITSPGDSHGRAFLEQTGTMKRSAGDACSLPPAAGISGWQASPRVTEHSGYSSRNSGIVSEDANKAGALAGAVVPARKKKRGPHQRAVGCGAVGRAPPSCGGRGGAGTAHEGAGVVEVSSDDEMDSAAAAAEGGTRGLQGRGDEVFELLLWMITTGDLGGGGTVFQMLGSAKGYLCKASIQFGDDDRFSFRSADEKGLVLSLAEAKGNIARELLSSDYTSTHDAHLTRSGGLENRGMAEDDFASLVYTLDHLRLIHPRIRQEGLNVTGKKLGKFSYFCVCCGKRFTFPVQDLVQHCQRAHQSQHQEHQAKVHSIRLARAVAGVTAGPTLPQEAAGLEGQAGRPAEVTDAALAQH